MTSESHFDITVQPADGATVVAVIGDLDAFTVPALRTAASHLIAEGRQHLVIDLSAVTFCDSAGLGALVGIHNSTRAANGCLMLAAVPPQLKRVMALTGVDTILSTHANVADALRAHS